MAMLSDLHAVAQSAWLYASMMAGVIMVTLRSYRLTHMLLVTLLACTTSRAEDSGGTSETGGRDQQVRAIKE